MMVESLEDDQHFLKKTILSLTDQIDLFETFQDLSLKIISQFNLENILETFCTIVNEMMNYQSAVIYLFDESGIKFHQVFTARPKPKYQLQQLPEQKIINWVMGQGRWTILTDFQDKDAESIVSFLPIRSTKKMFSSGTIRFFR